VGARFCNYDIIAITETGLGSTAVLQNHLPRHKIYHLPAPTPGQAGAGIAVLIGPRLAEHTSLEECGVDPDAACLWIKVAAVGTHLEKDLYVGTFYVPPEGSNQLRGPDANLDCRFQRLTQHTAHFLGKGHVLLNGDINASVADLSDGALVCPAHRQCHELRVNQAGELLIQAARDMGLALLTGRAAGDRPATYTYNPTGDGITRKSRPDHVLVDPSLYPLVARHNVLRSRFGSDHHPLRTVLTLPAAPPPMTPPPTHPLPTVLLYDVNRQDPLFMMASDDTTQLHFSAAIGNLPDDLHQAAEDLAQAAFHMGTMAGLKERTPGAANGRAPTRHRHKPWFDAECRTAIAKLRQARHAAQGRHTWLVAKLEHELQRLCKAKKRAFRRATALKNAQLAKQAPNRMWQALRPATSTSACVADLHTCRAHFCSTFDPTLPPTTAQAPPLQLGCPTDAPDHPLNADISVEEVVAALKQLRNNRSPGMDGLPPELLKYACPRQGRRPPLFGMNPLAPHLAAFFSHLLRHSVAPASWAATLVTLIHKKGDPGNWANYRPVAMVPLLPKVYAMILNNRLVGWAEAAGIRAPAQAGFRPQRSTTHHAFTLQHLIATYKSRHKKLYCCFVDLAKAYDSVPRDMLWQRLHNVGVRGCMLHAIKALYDVGVHMHIKTPAGTLDPIHATVGVKQGCPLSPTLFGIFIDSLQSHVTQCLPHAGPALDTAPHLRMSLLIYADDTAILANSAEELQQLVSCVDDWCTAHGMTISTAKSEVVVFGSKWKVAVRDVHVHVQGKCLPVSQAFKYLGVWFHCNTGIAHHVPKAAAGCQSSMLAAMFTCRYTCTSP